MIGDIQRVNDTYTNLSSTSRTIKKQMSFSTDTDQLFYHKNDDSLIKFGSAESYWTQQTGYLEPGKRAGTVAVFQDFGRIQGDGIEAPVRSARRSPGA